ncbi:MAG: MFS transporter [Leptospiraceae bacterium]|nr:MFS transporter [Leptospiraceae bacterium]
MNRQSNSIWSASALFVGTIFLVLGNGLQNTLLSVRAGYEGIASFLIGLMMAAYYTGYLTGSVYLGQMIQRVGHIRAFSAFVSLASAIALVHALFLEPYTWIGLRAINGLCYAGLIMVIESWLNAESSSQNRGQVLSIYTMIMVGGLAVSQLLLHIASPFHFILFCVVSILLSISLVPVALTRSVAPELPPAPRMSLRRLYTLSPTGLIGMVFIGIINGAFFGMTPVYLQQAGLQTGDIAWILSAGLTGAFVLQWPMGLVSDKVDRRWVLLSSFSFTGIVSLWLIMVQPDSFLDYVYGFVAFGGFGLTSYAICLAHVNDAVDASDILPVSSSLVLIFGFGAALGPMAAGLCMQLMGGEGLFLLMLVLNATAGLYLCWRIIVHVPVAVSEKEDFLPLPRTTPVALQMDERIPEEVL